MKLIGRNSVSEAIEAGTTIDRLVVQKGLKDSGAQKIITNAKSRGIKIFFRDKKDLDRETDERRHQGFLADVTDYKYCQFDDILDFAKEKKEEPFVLLLDGIEDPHNLGAIIRVAECVGVHGIIIPRHRACSINETVIKVSAGAASHVKIAKVTNINDYIELLQEKGVPIYALESGGDNIYSNTIKNKAIGLVVGGEGKGVKQLTKKKCDGILSIPMYGQINSLNASVACAIAAYELRERIINK